jgi:hypothetical protein
MLLQEQIEREAKTALGQASRATMARRAAIGKQPGAGFAGIEIFRVRPSACEQQERAGSDQTTPPSRRCHVAPCAGHRQASPAAVHRRAHRNRPVQVTLPPLKIPMPTGSQEAHNAGTRTVAISARGHQANVFRCGEIAQNSSRARFRFSRAIVATLVLLCLRRTREGQIEIASAL